MFSSSHLLKVFIGDARRTFRRSRFAGLATLIDRLWLMSLRFRLRGFTTMGMGRLSAARRHHIGDVRRIKMDFFADLP
jgi:hypothetical protein